LSGVQIHEPILVSNREVQSGKCEWIFKDNSGFANHPCRIIFIAMSSVQEIEAVIPKLSRAEVEEVRAWIDDFLEDQLELTDDVKARLDQSRREIAAGDYTTRQPK
jgi:hypothetical protein